MNTKPVKKPEKYNYITYEAKDKSGLIRVNKANKIVKSNMFIYSKGDLVTDIILKENFIEKYKS